MDESKNVMTRWSFTHSLLIFQWKWNRQKIQVKLHEEGRRYVLGFTWKCYLIFPFTIKSNSTVTRKREQTRESETNFMHEMVGTSSSDKSQCVFHSAYGAFWTLANISQSFSWKKMLCWVFEKHLRLNVSEVIQVCRLLRTFLLLN